MPAARTRPALSAAAPLLGQPPANFGLPPVTNQELPAPAMLLGQLPKTVQTLVPAAAPRTGGGKLAAIPKPKAAAAGPTAQKAKAGSSRGVLAESSGGSGLSAASGSASSGLPAASGSASRYMEAELMILIKIAGSEFALPGNRSNFKWNVVAERMCDLTHPLRTGKAHAAKFRELEIF